MTRFGQVLRVLNRRKSGFRIKCDSLLHRPRQGAARPKRLPAAIPDEKNEGHLVNTRCLDPRSRTASRALGANTIIRTECLYKVLYVRTYCPKIRTFGQIMFSLTVSSLQTSRVVEDSITLESLTSSKIQ